MSIAELIYHIKGYLDVDMPAYQHCYFRREDLEIIIKALEQEPCEDVVSRQAVIQHICENRFCYKENCKGNIYKRCPDIMWVYDLPSVTPKEILMKEKEV